LVNGKVFIAKLFGVMVAALLLAGSFPLPAYLSGMESPAAVWTGLVTLIIVIRTSRPKAAFWWSFLCGLLYNSVMLLWLLQLRHSWGYLPVVILSWLGLSAYCALYTGLFGLLLASVFPDPPEDYSVDVDIDSPELPDQEGCFAIVAYSDGTLSRSVLYAPHCMCPPPYIILLSSNY